MGWPEGPNQVQTGQSALLAGRDYSIVLLIVSYLRLIADSDHLHLNQCRLLLFQSVCEGINAHLKHKGTMPGHDCGGRLYIRNQICRETAGIAVRASA